MSAEHLSVNMTGIRERKREMVAKQVCGHLDLFRKIGAELILGTGCFVDSQQSRLLCLKARPGGCKANAS